MDSSKDIFSSIEFCTILTILEYALVYIIHSTKEEYFPNSNERVINIFLHCIGELVYTYQVLGDNTPIQIYHSIKGELVTTQVLIDEDLIAMSLQLP